MSALPESAEQYDRQTETERRFGPRQPVDSDPTIRVIDGVTRATIGDRIYEYTEGCVGLCVGVMRPFLFPPIDQSPPPAAPAPAPVLVVTEMDCSLWPSPRPKNFAMRLKLPKTTSRWSHESALDALALRARIDRATLLAMHPIDYLARVGCLMDAKILPKEEIGAYRGPVWSEHPWLRDWLTRLAWP